MARSRVSRAWRWVRIGSALALLAGIALPADVHAQQTQAGATAIDPALAEIIAGPHRAEKDRARDIYRHPGETLTFFGLKPDMTVVEIWPGGGCPGLPGSTGRGATGGCAACCSVAASAGG